MSGPVRPASARPRRDAEGDAEHGAAPPTAEELDAIERHRVDWVTLLGASVVEDDVLRATFVSHDRPGSALNFVAVLRWPADEVAARLGEVSERMRAAGAWPSVIVADEVSQPADLPDQLHSAGWVPVGGERIMWTRHPATVPHLDPGLRVEAVTPATAIESARLEASVFGLHPDAIGDSAEMLGRAVETGRTRAFVLRLVGEPIATARLVPGPGVAGLHAIGVAVRHRRRGYGRMVTAVATRAGLATGHKLFWLSVDDANAAAVELYESLGFAKSFSWTRWAAPQ